MNWGLTLPCLPPLWKPPRESKGDEAVKETRLALTSRLRGSVLVLHLHHLSVPACRVMPSSSSYHPPYRPLPCSVARVAIRRGGGHQEAGWAWLYDAIRTNQQEAVDVPNHLRPLLLLRCFVVLDLRLRAVRKRAVLILSLNLSTRGPPLI